MTTTQPSRKYGTLLYSTKTKQPKAYAYLFEVRAHDGGDRRFNQIFLFNVPVCSKVHAHADLVYLMFVHAETGPAQVAIETRSLHLLSEWLTEAVSVGCTCRWPASVFFALALDRLPATSRLILPRHTDGWDHVKKVFGKYDDYTLPSVEVETAPCLDEHPLSTLPAHPLDLAAKWDAWPVLAEPVEEEEKEAPASPPPPPAPRSQQRKRKAKSDRKRMPPPAPRPPKKVKPTARDANHPLALRVDAVANSTVDDDTDEGDRKKPIYKGKIVAGKCYLATFVERKRVVNKRSGKREWVTIKENLPVLVAKCTNDHRLAVHEITTRRRSSWKNVREQTSIPAEAYVINAKPIRIHESSIVDLSSDLKLVDLKWMYDSELLQKDLDVHGKFTINAPLTSSEPVVTFYSDQHL